MAEVVGTAVIETGVEPIWELMCSPGRYPDFVENTERMVDVGSGEFGVGYEYKEYGGLKPFIGESEWRVTEFDPMRHQTHIGDDGKVRIHLDIDLESLADDRTRLTLKVALAPAMVPRAGQRRDVAADDAQAGTGRHGHHGGQCQAARGVAGLRRPDHDRHPLRRKAWPATRRGDRVVRVHAACRLGGPG